MFHRNLGTCFTFEIKKKGKTENSLLFPETLISVWMTENINL